MTTSIDTVSPPAGPPPLWQGLIGIIDKPNATFTAALAHTGWRRWSLPLLLYLLAFIIVTAAQTPYLRELSLQQAEAQLAQLTAEQAEAARASMELTTSLPFLLATGIGIGAIALLIGLLMQTAYFYLTALVVGGNDTTFGDLFTVSAWSRLPLAIGFLVQAVFVAVSQGAIKYPGLAALVASGDPLADAQNPLIGLLARLDLFWLWHLLLVTLGVAIAARMSRGKSLALTVIYAALVLAMAVAPSLLAQAFGG